MEIVSIIFVHYSMDEDRNQLARQSYLSLAESTKDLPCELIVVDNGGDYEMSEFFLKETEAKRITHYIRNADNVWFGQGRNQGLRIATGEYLVVVDDDLIYQKDWLKICLDVLKQTKGQKLMVTPMPILSCHKRCIRKEEFIYDGKKYLINWRVGSNCWLMHKKDYENIGEFIDHHFSGTKWTNRYSTKGYGLVVVPGELVKDCGDSSGYIKKSKLDRKNKVSIKKQLTNGEKVVYFEGVMWEPRK